MVRKMSALVGRGIVTCMTDRPSRSRGSHAARWSIAAVVACVVALPGCAKLGPDFKRPDVAVADQWADAADPTLKLDTTVAQAWWQVFGDPVLDRLVESAYRQNLNLRIAGVRVLEARAELGIAVGGRYPQRQQIGAGATYVSLSESAANTALLDLNYWEFDTGFDAAWELDFWGKFSRGIESADATLLGSIAGDFALANGSYGGLFLAGGIVPTMIPFLQSSAFHQRFCNKGAMANVLLNVPVYVITTAQPGLIGAAHATGVSAGPH